jgi:phospholipid transport system substrate-binding protein
VRCKLSLGALLIVAAVAVLPPTPARAADDGASLITDLGNQAIQVLSSQHSEAEREKQFRELFEKGFDAGAIARFVLGPYWRTASEAQRQEFVRLFTTFIVHVYTVRFNEFTNQQFKVTGSRPEGDSSTLVTSQITGPGREAPLRIDWRVAKTEKGSKISDVIVEGVSMAITERQEFTAVIQRAGGQIDALLKMLREKTNQG